MPASSDQLYVAREKAHAVRRDAERGRSAVLARLRLGTFLAGVACLTWWVGFGGGSLACAIALGFLLIFGILVVVHARVEARAAWFESLRVVNARGTARLDRKWEALPDAPPPAGVDVDAHPYAIDLDVFGRASLFQWIGPAATKQGSRTLAGWLLQPAPREEVDLRHGAVAELSPLDEWREQLAAFGVSAATSRAESLAPFLEWAESASPSLRGMTAVRVAVYAILAALWILLPLHLTGVMPNSLWPLPLLAGIVLSFATAVPLTRAFDRAGAGERAIRQYAGVLEHIESQEFAAPCLRAVKSRLTVPPVAGTARAPLSAAAAMRGLNRILGFADFRHGAALLHFPVQAFTLWDFHCLFALERWRRAAGPRVRDWFDAAGELDALSCLAGIHRDNPDWCFPEITAERRYIARGLGHPLLPAARRVTNDVEVGPPGTVLLVTGSNMSGKSTLLRAIGVNAVLAEAGAPVCADSLRMPTCDVQTSIRIQDSLERGVSYFMAALARLKRVVDAAQREPAGRVLFYLLDEILQGTNSAERGIAVQAVARHLLDAGAIGVMTTHDLNLAGEEPLRSAARLVHFTETVDERGTMKFDYRLRDGLATSRNALRLMEMIGIDVKASPVTKG